MTTLPVGEPGGPQTHASAGAVIVIDDDPSYARLAQLILEEDLPDGCVALSASSVREALALAEGVPVRCVVLDLSVVAEDDGFAAIELLRAGGLTAPVIVLSGRADPGLPDVAVARGAAGYVLKGDEHGGVLGRAVTAHLS